jgi:hypothetical protein
MRADTQTGFRGMHEAGGGLPRRPHTTVMGVMGLALLAMTGWAFLHEIGPRSQLPSFARHAQVSSSRGKG